MNSSNTQNSENARNFKNTRDSENTHATTGNVTAGRTAVAALAAAVLASAVNATIAASAVAAGVHATMQLTPVVDVLFSTVGAVVAAIGWRVVQHRSADPARLLRTLVPVILLVSFVPDALLAAATASSTGVTPVLVLATMHVTTAAIAVTVYRKALGTASTSRRAPATPSSAVTTLPEAL